jgi:tRNA (cmo5U34)-methyltransferase
VSQFHFDPTTYLEMIRGELGRYDELQDAVADATKGRDAQRILELGTGTGETSRRLLALHPGASLVGIDVSGAMLEEARRLLPPERVELRVARLEDPLPPGPFDLVASALAVHHLDASGKRGLFRRVIDLLASGGVFVLGDVVVPERPEDAVAPLTADFDRPDRADEQMRWLAEVGMDAQVVWSWKDLAVLRAERR